MLDVIIGQRVRLARLLAGISQSALGKECGTTFQQIQKYENGTNRVSASRLYLIAKALNQPLIYFFQGIEEGAPPPELTGERDRQLLEFLKAAHAISPDMINILTRLLRSLRTSIPEKN